MTCERWLCAPRSEIFFEQGHRRFHLAQWILGRQPQARQRLNARVYNQPALVHDLPLGDEEAKRIAREEGGWAESVEASLCALDGDEAIRAAKRKEGKNGFQQVLARTVRGGNVSAGDGQVFGHELARAQPEYRQGLTIFQPQAQGDRLPHEGATLTEHVLEAQPPQG